MIALQVVILALHRRVFACKTRPFLNDAVVMMTSCETKHAVTHFLTCWLKQLAVQTLYYYVWLKEATLYYFRVGTFSKLWEFECTNFINSKFLSNQKLQPWPFTVVVKKEEISKPPISEGQRLYIVKKSLTLTYSFQHQTAILCKLLIAFLQSFRL